MKKQLLSIAVLLSATSAMAQPTIQASQFNYTSLSSFEYKYASSQQTPIAQPGASGANVIWDFSNIVTQSTVNYVTDVCPGDADCGLFAGANQVVKLSNVGGAKVYYNKTQNSMEQVGEKGMGPDGNAVFSDPMKVMQFPVSFGQTFTDGYSYGNSSGTRSGTLTSTIDAYGTLKTPAGTYTNVLRQKIVENSTVEVGGQTLAMLITHYYWTAPGVHKMLMSLISTQVTVAGITQTTYVATYSASSGTGIADNEALSSAITVYPNPASEKLTVETANLDITDIEFYNVLGQKVLTQAVTNKSNTASVTLNNLALTKGCYFLKINTNKGLVTKQIAIR